MPSDLNIIISIGARDAGRNRYAVQLQHEGKGLADIWARIDRQALLEDEHKFSAHDYGMELYDALFTGKLGRAYQRLIGQAGTAAHIRVQLVIHPDAPELHALSWERLFHVFGDGETPLAADARTPFSRFLVSGHGDQPPVQERPLRLLVAIANPTGLPDACPPLHMADEADSLARVLAELPGRVQGTLLAGRTDLPDDLRQRLYAQGWTLRDGVTSWQAIQRWLPGHHVLHILAHGQFKAGEASEEGTAYLLLEHEGSDRVARGGLDRIADDDIVTGLAGVHPLPQLVFLAACDSARRPKDGKVVTGANPFVGLAPRLVEGGVPAVVAMQDQVPADMAHTLAADFYRRLFDHGQVDRALNEARSLVYRSDEFSWAIPALFMRLKDGRLFAKPEAAPPRRRLRAPSPPDYFAGRVQELKRLRDRLTARPDAAVTVAIQGVGGQGKSALAKKLGQQLDPHFPGGVLWVDVGPGAYEAGRRAEIVNRIALELGLDLKDEPLPEKREAIVRSELGREGRLLAILDDVWEVDAGRWLRERVLPDGGAALVTSRDLGVCRALASHVERLPGLPVPDGLRLLANLLGELGQHEEGARELVILLDGHALALELAARQTLGGPRGLLRIKAQLERTPSLDILTLEGEERRDTSVARCFLLSYQRLDPEQQRRYRALGAFAQAPFDLPALAEIWGDAGGGEGPAPHLAVAAEVATWLVRRGLLTPAEDRLATGVELEQPVYAQHALLRRYALALLEEAQERDAAAKGHAAHYGRLPAQSWQLAELFWPQVEHAWRWVDGRSLVGRLRFLEASKDFAWRRGLWEPVRWRTAALLTELEALGERPADQAYLSLELGSIASTLGDKAGALEYYEQALPLFRQLGDKGGEATTLNNIGTVYDTLGEKAQALQYYEQALPLTHQVGDKGVEAMTFNNIGAAYLAQSEVSQALKYFEQALPLQRQAGDEGGEAMILNNIGRVYEGLGDKAQALQYYEQALQLYRQVGEMGGEATALTNLGGLYRALGEEARAQAYFEQALPLFGQVGDRGGEAKVLNNIGAVYADLGEVARALGHFEQALPLFRQLGDKGGEATTLNNIGAVYAELGDKAQALAYCEQALPLTRQVGDKGGEAQALTNIGGVYLALGEGARALQYFEQALSLFRQVGDRWGETVTCANMAMIYAGLGDLAQVERLLARMVALDEATGHPDLEDHRAALEGVRKRLQRQVELGQQLLPRVRQARDGNQALAAELTPLLEQFATQEDAPELQILGRVLRQLLDGETAPDLSGLPPELAGAVGAAFDLAEP